MKFVFVCALGKAKCFNANIAQGQPGGIAPCVSVAPVLRIVQMKVFHAVALFSANLWQFLSLKPLTK